MARLYFRDDESEAKFDAGWLRTGDIAAIDERSYIMISDRTKDVIKSGGEWISSVELEVEIMAHPAVQEAVGKFDKKVLGRLEEGRLERLEPASPQSRP